MKKIILITALISLNVIAKGSDIAAQETIKKSGKIISGLVGKVTDLENKIENFKTHTSLTCKSTNTSSGNSTSDDINIKALVPHSYKEEGYVVTGGGCKVIPNSGGYRSFIVSNEQLSDGSGWKCSTRHIPNFSGSRRINASVIYCKVSFSE